MQFELSEEQKDEIIKDYETDESLIKKIEAGLNETELVKDAEDYFALVCSVIAQYMTFEEEKKREPQHAGSNSDYMSLSEIIVKELGFRYQNFEDDMEENRLKFEDLVNSIKKRHN